MRTDGPTLTADTPIRRAVALLVGARAAAVIADDGRPIGILTWKDCFRPALHASYHQGWAGRVADHMSPRVIAVDAQDEVIHVAEMFVTSPRRVFVVREGAGVAGLVQRSDMRALLARLG